MHLALVRGVVARGTTCSIRGRDAREAELLEVGSEAFAGGVSAQGTHHAALSMSSPAAATSAAVCSVVASTSIRNSSKSTSHLSKSCAYVLRPAMAAYGPTTQRTHPYTVGCGCAGAVPRPGAVVPSSVSLPGTRRKTPAMKSGCRWHRPLYAAMARVASSVLRATPAHVAMAATARLAPLVL